jgi:hypothetical protein
MNADCLWAYPGYASVAPELGGQGSGELRELEFTRKENAGTERPRCYRLGTLIEGYGRGCVISADHLRPGNSRRKTSY